MALQYSGVVRDNQINTIEGSVNGTGAPTLEIRSGAVPASCAAADTGVALSTITLAADFLTSSTGGAGQVAKVGTWTDTADATGTASYFRIKGGTTTHIQGTVGLSASTPDMVVDNTSFQSGQAFTVNSFTISIGNA